MAFDRNNPADLLALKNEVNTDPTGIGYDINSTTDIVAKINDASLVQPPVLGQDRVTAEKLLEAIFPESISSQDQFKIQLAFEISSGVGADLSSLSDEIGGLSPGLATAIAGITRELSRAEVLFAQPDVNNVTESVVITRDDWLAARDS